MNKLFSLQTIKAYLLFTFLIFSISAMGQESEISFSVSMDEPSTHYFDVSMTIEGFSDDTLLLKMPVWTPGYYLILDHAKYVGSFTAQNSAGESVPFHKTSKNKWQLITNGDSKISVTYKVFAYNQSVAEPFLDDGRAFIVPTGVFMNIEGYINHPVNVSIKPYKEWDFVESGLDVIDKEANKYFASNFDVLYDSPILVGDLHVDELEFSGLEHTVAFEKPVRLDLEKYYQDLEKIVKYGSAVIGEIPYDHYTYLHLGRGGGGLEHLNSMAVYSNMSYDITQSDGYKNWLAFIAHEYFHLYNVKRIRPIELGPFDYDRENFTNMLWVAEGLTVYYEYIILNQAEILDQQEALDMYSKVIRNFENIPGRKFQTATESSFDTWSNFFNRSNHTQNTSLSYYDIGCTLGLLLDLAIRHDSNNQKSLQDVMRKIYYEYHKELGRGYTEEEFRAISEEMAGTSLDEVFEYTNSTEPFDYAKYLAYAGLQIDLEPKTLPGGFLGASLGWGSGMNISFVEVDSPAWKAGLSVKDEILEINGEAATRDLWNSVTKEGNPGDEIQLKVTRRTGEKLITVRLGQKFQPDYKITPIENPTAKQQEILNGWLK